MGKSIVTLIWEKISALIRPKSIFGWKSAFSNYGWKGFLIDSILPFIISSILCVTIYLKDIDVFLQLKHLVEIGVDIVPAMVALILAAYTIMLTFILGEKFSSIKSSKAGKDLIRGLNASFAVCLLISTITIMMLVVVSCIAHINIKSSNSNAINYFVLFVLCFLFIYSIAILIGITIDVFNCGQTTLINSEKQIEIGTYVKVINGDRSGQIFQVAKFSDTHFFLEVINVNGQRDTLSFKDVVMANQEEVMEYERKRHKEGNDGFSHQ